MTQIGETKLGYEIGKARLVLEYKLNRQLPCSIDVHHINGIKDDDRPENLVEMPHGKHVAFHNKERGR